MPQSRNNQLTNKQRKIVFEKGTEPPFSGEWLHNEQAGDYVCINCRATLFSSQHKFDSKSGWPSFCDVAQYGAVKLQMDSSHGMERVEATCAACDAHLGHVFDDAVDQPTGKRYCINSLALDFVKQEEDADA